VAPMAGSATAAAARRPAEALASPRREHERGHGRGHASETCGSGSGRRGFVLVAPTRPQRAMRRATWEVLGRAKGDSYLRHRRGCSEGGRRGSYLRCRRGRDEQRGGPAGRRRITGEVDPRGGGSHACGERALEQRTMASPWSKTLARSSGRR